MEDFAVLDGEKGQIPFGRPTGLLNVTAAAFVAGSAVGVLSGSGLFKRNLSRKVIEPSKDFQNKAEARLNKFVSNCSMFTSTWNVRTSNKTLTEELVNLLEAPKRSSECLLIEYPGCKLFTREQPKISMGQSQKTLENLSREEDRQSTSNSKHQSMGQ